MKDEYYFFRPKETEAQENRDTDLSNQQSKLQFENNIFFNFDYIIDRAIFNCEKYVIDDDETTTDNDDEITTDNNEPNDEQPLLPQHNPKFRKSYFKYFFAKIEA